MTVINLISLMQQCYDLLKQNAYYQTIVISLTKINFENCEFINFFFSSRVPVQLHLYQKALNIRNFSLTNFLCSITGVKKAGHTLKTNMFFDTIKFTPRNGQNEIIHRANKHRINLRYYLDGSVRNLSLLRLHVS